jgi:hypothetical protein
MLERPEDKGQLNQLMAGVAAFQCTPTFSDFNSRCKTLYHERKMTTYGDCKPIKIKLIFLIIEGSAPISLKFF